MVSAFGSASESIARPVRKSAIRKTKRISVVSTTHPATMIPLRSSRLTGGATTGSSEPVRFRRMMAPITNATTRR